MRRWAAHAVFATILLGSLAAQKRDADLLVDAVGFERAVLRVARSHNFGFRECTTVPGTTLRTHTLAFEAPGCSQCVFVGLRLASFEEESLQPAPQEGYARRYVYIDRKWNKPPDALTILAQRAKYEALAAVGLTEEVPSRYLLQVDAPEQCQSAAAMDWRLVWNRNYLVAGHANTEATNKQ
jgi:hypothetical protein